MEPLCNEWRGSNKIGDKLTSDVVVRLRTQDGRDDWLYCHSCILIEKCKYFADRLSDSWPTCQILDARNCVEVYCKESEFNYYVNVIRLLYVVVGGSAGDLWHGVRNALGILRTAVELGCPDIITACVNYLEAVPWEEAEEEEILKIIPGMGSQAASILARLRPVNPSTIKGIFFSALQFATSSPPPSMKDLKSSAQEQLEYMLTEDDDAPLLSSDDEIRCEVRDCMMKLISRFFDLLESLLCETSFQSGNLQSFLFHLSDLLWACQLMTKLEIMREFVNSWVDASTKVVEVVKRTNTASEMLEIKSKIVELVAKILESIGCGTVILPIAKRLHMVKVWLPFTRKTKPLIDSIITTGDDTLAQKLEDEVWQTLESAFVSVILALPSVDQAEILTEWLGNEHIQYPDLTEAFEMWCYRSKIAKRRLAQLGESMV